MSISHLLAQTNILSSRVFLEIMRKHVLIAYRNGILLEFGAGGSLRSGACSG